MTRSAHARSLRRFAALAALVIGLALLAPASFSALQADAGKDAKLRVAVVGASVSAGYNNAPELGTRADVRLGLFLQSFVEDAASLEPFDRGNRFFFRSPRVIGVNELTRALKSEPDAVIAVDFLFWYAYGVGFGRDKRRAAGLERGLKTLERVEVPLVLGDLPKIDHALEGVGPFGGPLIRPSMLPTEEERARLNARIYAWAAERENVRVVGLEDFTARCLALEPLELRGNAWSPGEISEVLQRDLLHPKRRSTLWVALAIWDTLAELGAAPAELDWNVDRADTRLEARLGPLRRRAKNGAELGNGR